MTFIPNTPPTTDPAVDAVANLAFWPELAISALRNGYRVDTTISDGEARAAIAAAARSVNAELATWQATQETAGNATLVDVPSPDYGGTTALVAEYLSAVYNRARAKLVEDYRNYDTTKSGHDQADAIDDQADIFLARSRAAIRAILGTTRTTVELI